MKNETAQHKKIKSFWGIVLIFVAGMVSGGIIYAVAYNDMLTEDINSMVFLRHREDKTPKEANLGDYKSPASIEITK